MQIVIVTGRSGSGKTVALRVLEDQGFYCVDNIPLNLLPELIKTFSNDKLPLAISIDVRNLPKDPAKLTANLNKLKQQYDITTIYLDTETQALIKRFSETRRRHPLGNMSLEQAIISENKLLTQLKIAADLLIDTTNLSIHSLSEMIKNKVVGKQEKELVIIIESFGFKYGLPNDADFIFDVRFLPNPHWVSELRSLTGLDSEVATYLAEHACVNDLIDDIYTFANKWLSSLKNNNRSYLTIAIGCTGGQHRSVYVSEQLAARFKEKQPNVKTRHRSLEMQTLT